MSQSQDDKGFTERAKRPSTFERVEEVHPHKMLVYLAVIGSGTLILFMLVMFASRPVPLVDEFYLPKVFHLSTVVLLLGTFLISRALPAIKAENALAYYRYLGGGLIAAVLFCLLQIAGWVELRSLELIGAEGTSNVYLNVLSSIHFIHMIGGMVVLVMFFLKAFRMKNDSVQTLIMVTNPYRLMKVGMLSIYWHFLDLMWLLVYFYFVFAY